jgi:hypothetical protein
MTLTLEISPETERELAREAELAGIAVPAPAKRILEDADPDLRVIIHMDDDGIITTGVALKRGANAFWTESMRCQPAGWPVVLL